jgi:stage III sporulation protein AF
VRELLREWVLSLTGAALLAAFALALTPEGRVRRVTRLLAGVVLALALVRPLADFDFDGYAASLAVSRDAAATAADGWEDAGKRLERTLIEAESAAYISDRAAELGLRVEAVSVTAKWGDALCWYPYEATLRSGTDDLARRALEARIASELGIPPERLHWEDLP